MRPWAEQDWSTDDLDLESVEPEYRRDVESALLELDWSHTWISTGEELLALQGKVQPGDFLLQLGWETGGRNRKGLVPAICEALGLPFWGADMHTHSLAKDKVLCKRYAQEVGFEVSPSLAVRSAADLPDRPPFELPAIVKPAYEGGSIGITRESVCHGWPEVCEQVTKILGKYHQPVLVEQFVRGAEVTVSVIGNADILRWGVFEILFASGSSFNDIAFSQELKKGNGERLMSRLLDSSAFPGLLTRTKALVAQFGDCDAYRLDMRLAMDGRLVFLEFNPDVHLGTNGSLFDLYSKAGLEYSAFFRDIVAVGASRWGIEVPERQQRDVV
jgi:D-alanine-D-alanine ligase